MIVHNQPIQIFVDYCHRIFKILFLLEFLVDVVASILRVPLSADVRRRNCEHTQLCQKHWFRGQVRKRSLRHCSWALQCIDNWECGRGVYQIAPPHNHVSIGFCIVLVCGEVVVYDAVSDNCAARCAQLGISSIRPVCRVVLPRIPVLVRIIRVPGQEQPVRRSIYAK